MNAVRLALTAAGSGLVMTSLVIGRFSTGDWSGYPPYTGIDFNPGQTSTTGSGQSPVLSH
jgi:cytochrome o ubiquinol oxidase subunit 1